MRTNTGFLVSILLLLAPLAPVASAHEASRSLVKLEVQRGETDGEERLTGRFEVALRDLDHAMVLDADGDSKIEWGELRTRGAEIADRVLAPNTWQVNGEPCAPRPGPLEIARHDDGAYASFALEFACARAMPRLDSVTLEYGLFAEVDPDHRAWVHVTGAAGSESRILGGERKAARFELRKPAALTATMAGYLVEGIWHIFIGLDHILFLFCLLLPAVIRDPGAPGGAVRLLGPVVRVVTAFTIAHSITLVSATLGWIDWPSRWVEAAIAASILFVAVSNMRPRWRFDGARLALGFGLIHGLGFASVLADLGLPTRDTVFALVGFNLGVEAGQLLIVGAFLPLALALRDSAFYARRVVPVGSAAMAVLAGIWLLERGLAIELVSFP